METSHHDKKTRRNIRLVVVGVLMFSAVTITALVNKMSQPRILNKWELQDYGALILDKPQALTQFQLLDERGEEFDQQDLVGKWTVVFFGFSHCTDICAPTMSVLGKTYAELKSEEQKEFEIVFVTVDPERDTPAVLGEYVSRFHSDFHGLSGSTKDLGNFASQLKVPYRVIPSSEEETLGHSANLILINPRGELHGFFKPPFAHGALRVVWRSLRATYSD